MRLWRLSTRVASPAATQPCATPPLLERRIKLPVAAGHSARCSRHIGVRPLVHRNAASRDGTRDTRREGSDHAKDSRVVEFDRLCAVRVPCVSCFCALCSMLGWRRVDFSAASGDAATVRAWTEGPRHRTFPRCALKDSAVVCRARCPASCVILIAQSIGQGLERVCASGLVGGRMWVASLAVCRVGVIVQPSVNEFSSRPHRAGRTRRARGRARRSHVSRHFGQGIEIHEISVHPDRPGESHSQSESGVRGQDVRGPAARPDASAGRSVRRES